MKEIDLDDDDSVSITCTDGRRLYITNDSSKNVFRIFADSPLSIRPQSNNAIDILQDETAAVRRNNKRIKQP